MIGKNPTEADYQNVAAEIQEFYKTCGTAHEHFASDLKSKFDDEPAEQAKYAIGQYEALKSALVSDNKIELLTLFSQRPIEKLSAIIKSLNDVESFAKRLHATHSNLLGDVETVDPLMLEGALAKLEELSNRIEEMEVAE